MISKEQNLILYLIRKSFSVESGPVPDFDDAKAVAGDIVRSSILLTVFPAVKACLEENELLQEQRQKLEELRELLEKRYLVSLRQALLQDYEGKRILESLSQAGLDCIALKGWELRKLYPADGMRQMADLDILVRPYDYKLIKEIMEKNGFGAQGDETSWKHDDFVKNEVHIEMHKRLTDDSGEIRDWEKQMWERAEKDGNSRIYRMCDEDYYVFHFVHLHKDMMNGTLGLRRIIDTWLLSRCRVDMNRVDEELERFDMSLFHERIVTLCRACMGEIPMDENSETLLKHAFSFGIYGTRKSYKASRVRTMGNGKASSGKIRSLLLAVFLPVKRMKAQFPVLEKHPVLLPFCWIKRIFMLLRGGMGKKREMLDYSDIGEDELKEISRFFEAGGIDVTNR
jgi:hypothetical protein